MNVLFGTNFTVGQTGHFAYIALQRMGVNVIPFTATESAPEGWLVTPPDVDMVELVESLDTPAPDCLFMVESSTGKPFLPRRIEELKIPTAYWLYDNYLNFRWNKEVAALFDYVFFAQEYRVNQAHKYGRKNVSWLPFAADEVFHRNFHVDRDIDIGYLGSITDQKKKYFADLEKNGLKVITNDRYLSYDEIGQFNSRCKLVYNILARRDMNIRTFEASYAGALVVNQSWIDEGCAKIFTDGQSMAFHSFTDAADVCKKLLANNPLRERMAANAEKIVASGQTYRHRMEKVLKVLERGVTEERIQRSKSYTVPVATALTCLNRDFKWYDRGLENLRVAFSRSFIKTTLYLLSYAWWRIWEKMEKIVWSFGKAPV